MAALLRHVTRRVLPSFISDARCCFVSHRIPRAARARGEAGASIPCQSSEFCLDVGMVDLDSLSAAAGALDRIAHGQSWVAHALSIPQTCEYSASVPLAPQVGITEVSALGSFGSQAFSINRYSHVGTRFLLTADNHRKRFPDRGFFSGAIQHYR